jgi:hypothetical protein
MNAIAFVAGKKSRRLFLVSGVGPRRSERDASDEVAESLPLQANMKNYRQVISV